MGVFCEHPTGDYYFSLDQAFECGSRSSTFANLDGNGTYGVRFTCNEGVTFPPGSTDSNLQTIQHVSIRTDNAWVDFGIPGCFRDAPPPPPTPAPTTSCQTLLRDAVSCVSVSNPECSSCIDQVYFSAQNGTCDAIERKLCVGYDECGCGNCASKINAFHSCELEEKGICEKAVDCSTVVESPSPTVSAIDEQFPTAAVPATQTPDNSPAVVPETKEPISASSSRSTAGVIGGAVAGVAVVLTMCLIALIMFRRRSRNTDQTKPPAQVLENHDRHSTGDVDASNSGSIRTGSPEAKDTSGPPIPEPDYADEIDIEKSIIATPLGQSHQAPYSPVFKDQTRNVLEPRSPQLHSLLSENSGGSAAGQKSTRQSYNENLNNNYGIPMATAVVPVKAQAVVEVESEAEIKPQTRRPKMDP
jgi:hypothetical protein